MSAAVMNDELKSSVCHSSFIIALHASLTRRVIIRGLEKTRRGANAMTTIVANSQVTTAITVFTVEPENQQQLVDLLVRAAKEVIQNRPGFISINIHKSLDK